MSSVKVLFILAVALTFKCVFSTSWFSKDIYSAPSPITPTPNNLIGTINQSDIMIFSMDITINSFPDSEWSNIFHFGNNNTERLPGIWLYDNTIGFHICMSTVNTWNHCINGPNTQFAPNGLQTDFKYSLKIIYTQSSLVLSINDINYYESYDYSSHTVLNDQAIYAGDPWWPSADVLIENLKISIPADLCGGYGHKYPKYIDGIVFAYSGSFHGQPYYQSINRVQVTYIYYNNNQNRWKWYSLLNADVVFGYEYSTNDEVDAWLGATWNEPFIVSAKVCGSCDSHPTQCDSHQTQN